jgi:pimeloyl-ACP methyl ester carboxylesterase
MGEYVADVLAVMDAAGVERAALVGYSDGANLFFRLAAEHPERVAAVVCIGGVYHPDDTKRLPPGVRGQAAPHWYAPAHRGHGR